MHQAPDSDGIPMSRYGFVKSAAGVDGEITVMFDNEIRAESVHRRDLRVVSATTVELRLEGNDLIKEAELRKGLLSLWLAEADARAASLDAPRTRTLIGAASATAELPMTPAMTKPTRRVRA